MRKKYTVQLKKIIGFDKKLNKDKMQTRPGHLQGVEGSYATES